MLCWFAVTEGPGLRLPLDILLVFEGIATVIWALKGFVSAAFYTGGCLWVGSGVSSEVRLTCVVGTGLTGIFTTASARLCYRSALLTRCFFLFSDMTESDSIELVSGSLFDYL